MIDLTVFSPGRVQGSRGLVYRWQCGEHEGESRQPLLDSARVLMTAGADPAEILVMRWRRTGEDSPERDGHEPADGIVGLTAPVGVAAKLTVDDDDRPRFRRWRDPDQLFAKGGAKPGQEPQDGDNEVTLVPAAPEVNAAHEAETPVKENS